MKKRNLFFASPLLLVLLFSTSCSSSESKIALIFGDEHASDVRDITYNDLKSCIDEKETFVLAVQPDTACVCWSDFYPILKNYILDTHIIVYHIKYDSFGDKDNFGLNIRKGYTTYAICENGEWKQNLLSGTSSIFKNKDAFYEYMSSVASLPHYFYVNLEDVDKLIKADEQSVIYFARNNCGDCSYVDKNVLKQYAQNNLNRKNMYILDCESIGIRQYEKDGIHLTPESQILWNEFKIKYGLAENNNPTYGFNSGYVPTFQVVKSSQYISGCVYFNDTIEKIDEKYIVKDTFYTQKRLANLQYLSGFTHLSVLEGLELNSSDVSEYNGYYSWNQDSANKYHKPLLEAFLDYYLK